MTSGPPAGDTAPRGSLPLICIGVSGIVTSVTMVGPLLVDIAREFNVSVGAAGLLAAAAAVPQALMSPFAGMVSDRIGRRPALVLSLAGLSVTLFGAALAPTFALLALARFLAGCVGAFGPTSLMASIGDLFAPARRAQAMGWFNMGFSVAAIGGVPAASAVAGWFGWRAAFAVIGVALGLLAIAMRVWYPSTAGASGGSSVTATFRAVRDVPRLGHVLGANFVERSMFGMMMFYVPAFLMLAYGRNAAQVAPFLALLATGAIAGNVIGGRLGDRLPRAAVFVLAQLAAAAIGFVLFGFGVGFGVAVGLAALFGLANSTGRPPFLALASELAPAHRGAMFGLIALTNQTGIVVGSALGALVIDVGGYVWFAVLAVLQGVAASVLAVPLWLRRPSAGLLHRDPQVR